MHPVNAMFEEIYRDHWGIPHTSAARQRHAQDRLFWRHAWRRRDDAAGRPERYGR